MQYLSTAAILTIYRSMMWLCSHGLATGRELNKRLYDQAATWGLDYQFDFLIGMNGGMIWDRFHEKPWLMDLMDQETMKEILAAAKNHGSDEWLGFNRLLDSNFRKTGEW